MQASELDRGVGIRRLIRVREVAIIVVVANTAAPNPQYGEPGESNWFAHDHSQSTTCASGGIDGFRAVGGSGRGLWTQRLAATAYNVHGFQGLCWGVGRQLLVVGRLSLAPGSQLVNERWAGRVVLARVSDRVARRGLLIRAGVGWFLCDSGGGGHAAATTSAITTVAGPEFLRTLVLVVARPPPLAFLRPLQRHRHRGAS